MWKVGGPSLVLGRALRTASDELVALSAPRAFRAKAQDISSLDEAIDIAIKARFRHYDVEVWANQKKGEIKALLQELQLNPPERVLEIGTSKGGTFWLFAQVAAPDATLVSVDLPGNEGGGYPARYEKLYRAFARDRQIVKLVRRDSHSLNTVENVREIFDGSIDFPFIDGDHSYAGVKRDFELYGPLVRPGGVIAFHDIVPGPEALVGGVPRFWGELKARHAQTHEYICDWSQSGWGIGVILVPPQLVACAHAHP